MKLPNREKAYIPVEKLNDYLLSNTHPVGRLKAKFFNSLGFSSINIGALEQRILGIAYFEEVESVITSPHGTKYIIDGLLQGTIGIQARIRTVWIIDIGEERPRFVTAYPA
jgi:hypothetical protein